MPESSELLSIFMDQQTRQMAVDISEGYGKALVVGNDVMFAPWKVGDRPFSFSPDKTRFIWALQKNNGNIELACEFVNKPRDWATKFLSSRKWKEFIAAKLAAMGTQNGDLVSWWWQYGTDGARGFKEGYRATCHLCHGTSDYSVTEAEIVRRDDMSFAANCKTCLQSVELAYWKEEFKPTREMVQFWQELGNRLSPKIERVQHEYTKETFVFMEGST